MSNFNKIQRDSGVDSGMDSKKMERDSGMNFGMDSKKMETRAESGVKLNYSTNNRKYTRRPSQEQYNKLEQPKFTTNVPTKDKNDNYIMPVFYHGKEYISNGYSDGNVTQYWTL